MMAGLDPPLVAWSAPAIVEGPAPLPCPVAVVFQAPSLLPPLTVLENTALPLILDGVDEGEARGHAAEALARLDLTDLSDKLPEEISGGQAQRVAAARALAGRPRLLLADPQPARALDDPGGAPLVDAVLDAAAAAGAAILVPTVAARLEERREKHCDLHSSPLWEPTWARASSRWPGSRACAEPGAAPCPPPPSAWRSASPWGPPSRRSCRRRRSRSLGRGSVAWQSTERCEPEPGPAEAAYPPW